MNKSLIVALAAFCLLRLDGSAQADVVQRDHWQVEFIGSEGARVHGSIVWIDANNANKPTYMETVDAISQASKRLILPIGAIVSADGSSDLLKPVVVKIYRNNRECNDNPAPETVLSNSKTCKP
jgi:hypothetical protein